MPRPPMPADTQGAKMTRLAGAARIISRSSVDEVNSLKARAVEAKLYSHENGFAGSPCDPWLAITEWFNNGFQRMRRLDKEGTKVQIIRESGIWVTIYAKPIASNSGKA